MLRSSICVVLVAFGCGPTVGVDSTGEDPTSTGDTSTDPTTTTSTSSASTSTTLPPDQTTGSREPDVGVVAEDVYAHDCSYWDQDCPPGQKCMPYSTDGETVNATRCSPIAPDPAAPGEACVVQDNPLSGLDTCDGTSMCWFVDPQTLEGTCFGFCMGSELDPTCAQPMHWCPISSDTVVPLCIPQCHPLEDDCPPGEGCYAVHESFACAPDASGRAGAYGDPCEFLNACDPGLQCVNPAAVPGCAAFGCCSPFCDITDPDASCPGEGQVCLPWVEEPAPRYHMVGICVVPGYEHVGVWAVAP